nr:hypothetical protein [Brevundimonas diminuta]
MAEVKHTPGPWRVVGPDPAGKNPHVGLWEVHGKGHIASDVSLFDGRLIAAAPDLFEAGTELQAARKAQNADPSAENASRVRAASDTFDAALSKATAQQEGR